MTERDPRRFLAALAGHARAEETAETDRTTEGSYRHSIDAATAATEDFESAAAFLANRDLEELERAVERAEADLSARAATGRDALASLRELRAAAVGQCQFQSGLSSPLGDDDEASSR